MKYRVLLAWMSAWIVPLSVALPAYAEMATLLGDPGSTINVRAEPSTAARAPHYGLPGDRVDVIRATQPGDRSIWYLVEFPGSGARGWIRGDLVLLDSTAETQAERVTFGRGQSSAGLTGTIQGYQTRTYRLNARQGQEMTVRLNGSSRFTQFAVFSPNGDTLYAGSGTWVGHLPQSGDYRVRVGLVRAEARRSGVSSYTLTVGIQ